MATGTQAGSVPGAGPRAGLHAGGGARGGWGSSLGGRIAAGTPSPKWDGGQGLGGAPRLWVGSRPNLRALGGPVGETLRRERC